jgi:hypothetical protein
MGYLPGARSRCCWQTPSPLRTHGPSGHQTQSVRLSCRNPSLCARLRSARPLAVDCPRCRKEHCRRYTSQWLVPRSVPTHFLATPLATSREDPSDRPSMAGSKDSSDVSPSNNIESTMETLRLKISRSLRTQGAADKEVQAKFLANF